MNNAAPYSVFHTFKRVFDTLGLGSLILIVMLLMSDKVGTIWNGQPQPVIEPTVHLEVTSLEFLDGLFSQLVQPMEKGKARQADWSASIWRDNQYVCGGHGRGTYISRDEPVLFTPDQWTGDDCGPLTYGGDYIGVAAWEYVGNDDVIYTLSAKINFIYTGRPMQ